MMKEVGIICARYGGIEATEPSRFTKGEYARMAMRRLNCWEYQGCGFGPNGSGDAGNGVCPSASAQSLDGHNSGKNGGRSCWVISGTLCNGSPSPDYENKIHICKKCAFHHRVAVEEGINYVDSETLLSVYRKRGIS